MISYLKGLITHKTPTLIYVEVSGVGYEVHISLNTYAKIEALESVKILIYPHIKEDSHTLYGFSDDDERALFIHLISVSGIGPNTARVVLSTLSVEETRSAIINEEVATFNKVKGIGAKTAKRIILDLKDKIVKEGGSVAVISSLNNTMKDEALSALVALGFNKIAVQKALKKIANSGKPIERVEELIKIGLKELSQ